MLIRFSGVDDGSKVVSCRVTSGKGSPPALLCFAVLYILKLIQVHSVGIYLYLRTGSTRTSLLRMYMTRQNHHHWNFSDSAT